MIVGIDYGSKLAGTTAICYDMDNVVNILQSRKKQDADQMIIEFIGAHSVSNIGIDAPLSLPGAYFQNGNDYFYRECDRMLKAMSPMFLGGLTARAMKLQHDLGRQLFEVYPKGRMNRYDRHSNWYKKDLQKSIEFLAENCHLPLSLTVENWHQFDSVIAWMITRDIALNKAESVGIASEGSIYY